MPSELLCVAFNLVQLDPLGIAAVSRAQAEGCVSRKRPSRDVIFSGQI